MSRQFWQYAETKISAGVSHVTPPAELNEMVQYIQGSTRSTVILSDHKNLTYYREAKKLTRQQARWSLYLSEFDVKLVHTPGSKMVQSDALSWQPDLCPDEDNDNEDIVMLRGAYHLYH